MPAVHQGFKLRVFMTGLCVFVLPKKANQPVQVLLANAGTDERIKEVTGQNVIRPHKPVLQYEVANRVSDVPNYPLFQDPTGKLNGLWHLDLEDLEVVLDTSQKLMVRNLGPAASEEKYKLSTPGRNVPVRNGEPREPVPFIPNNVDNGDFFWISPARNRSTNEGVPGRVIPAKDLYLQPKLKASEVGDNLAARFIIHAGKIEPAGFSFDSATKELFIYNLGGVEQAVASVVEWSLEVPNNSVTFKTTTFDGHSATRRHRYLTLAPEPGESDVEVWLLNREIDEVIGQNPPVESEFEGPLRQRHEYLFLSQLLQEPEQSATPVRGKLPRLASSDQQFKQARIRNRTMRRIYFPGEDGEGDHVGGPCSPLSTTGG